ncbi:MAG: ATP synthase F1 subunit gamma [Clostridia bacterium]|nr:ATP synthase F1 subunit gamma [Clostridia bacterium]
MGADTKALRIRIKSVDSTLHLTKAMGLVASSKIRRAGQALSDGKAYAASLDALVEALTAGPECKKSRYMAATGTRTCLVVIAGDRGLAGGYNANIFRLMRAYPDAKVYGIGKRACDRFGTAPHSAEHFSGSEAFALAKEICDDFLAGKFDRFGVVYTRYISMMAQEATLSWLLPLTPPQHAKPSGIIFEPSEQEILGAAVPEYIAGKLSAFVRESFLSEVAARRMAMDSASKNAQSMIDNLELSYNRARQGAITQEITEIVAGSGNV